MKVDRARQQRRREQAREIVAAYANDEDADLYNLVDAGVRDDGMAMGYALARLAAVAVEELAQLTGRTPDEVLSALAEPSVGEKRAPALAPGGHASSPLRGLRRQTLTPPKATTAARDAACKR